MARRKRLAMTTLGGLLMAGTVVGASRPAAAANFTDTSSEQITFVSGGTTVTCDVLNETSHNTDSAEQPYVSVATAVSGDNSACSEPISVTIYVEYKDKSGVQRNATFSAARSAGSVTISGTYSPITTSVTGMWFCESDQGTTCSATAAAAPK